MRHLLDNLNALSDWLATRGQPRFRRAQIQHWLFAGRVQTFGEMTDLPQPLRDQLAQEFSLWTMRVVTHRENADGTEKLLLELADRQQIECVLLRDGSRRTICISTQVG
jgi:23S rRNA (adenine2503-C2)-methyltransferase